MVSQALGSGLRCAGSWTRNVGDGRGAGTWLQRVRLVSAGEECRTGSCDLRLGILSDGMVLKRTDCQFILIYKVAIR